MTSVRSILFVALALICFLVAPTMLGDTSMASVMALADQPIVFEPAQAQSVPVPEVALDVVDQTLHELLCTKRPADDSATLVSTPCSTAPQLPHLANARSAPTHREVSAASRGVS